jgi:hypothetical protein
LKEQVTKNENATCDAFPDLARQSRVLLFVGPMLEVRPMVHLVFVGEMHKRWRRPWENEWGEDLRWRSRSNLDEREKEIQRQDCDGGFLIFDSIFDLESQRFTQPLPYVEGAWLQSASL